MFGRVEGQNTTYAELSVGNKMSQIEINAKVDTGAMSNLIPWECFKQLKYVHLRDTPIRLFAFGRPNRPSGRVN